MLSKNTSKLYKINTLTDKSDSKNIVRRVIYHGDKNLQFL